ncbi:MAG: DUF805 domain-containing protein, partial [Abditibacteriota bacterium]|nr:DUF805 domain-containing protein [Abditibacteriota bacterium]
FANKCNLQEYWSFVILCFDFMLLAGGVGGLLDLMFKSGGAAFSYALTLMVLIGAIVPLFSATARRLRNAGLRRRWIFAAVVPFVIWLPFAGSEKPLALIWGIIALAGWLLLYVLLLLPDKDPQEGLV